MEKTREKELGTSCQLKIYLKVLKNAFNFFQIVETIVDNDEPAILDEFLGLFSSKVPGGSGDGELENLPSLVGRQPTSLTMVQVKACREDNYPMVTAFVRYGFRWGTLKWIQIAHSHQDEVQDAGPGPALHGDPGAPG